MAAKKKVVAKRAPLRKETQAQKVRRGETLFKRITKFRTAERLRQRRGEQAETRKTIGTKRTLVKERSQARRAEIFERRKGRIAATRVGAEERRVTEEHKTGQRIRLQEAKGKSRSEATRESEQAQINVVQARGEARKVAIDERFARQQEVEEQRLQRRLSYQEVQAARRRPRQVSNQPGFVSKTAGQPFREGGTSVLGILFRIGAVIIGLALLLLVVSHADQSSSAVGTAGSYLVGITSSQPLFQPKETTSASSAGAK